MNITKKDLESERNYIKSLISGLKKFTNEIGFRNLVQDEKERIIRQCEYMGLYLNILEERIKNL